MTTKTPDLLPCPSKEAREHLAAEYEALGMRISARTIRSDRPLYGAKLAGARAIDKALSRHSASTVDVEEALRVQTDVGLYEALKDLLSVDDIKRQIWSTDMSSKKRDKMLQSNDGHRKIAEDKARAALSTFESSRLGVRNG